MQYQILNLNSNTSKSTRGALCCRSDEARSRARERERERAAGSASQSLDELLEERAPTPERALQLLDFALASRTLPGAPFPPPLPPPPIAPICVPFTNFTCIFDAMYGYYGALMAVPSCPPISGLLYDYSLLGLETRHPFGAPFLLRLSSDCR